MGDDLVEKTRVVSTPQGESPPSGIVPDEPLSTALEDHPLDTPERVQDQMESARILIGEGFTDEAKRILRRVLLVDPGNIVARTRLEEIHEIELAQILSGSPDSRQGKIRGGKRDLIPLDVDAEEVVRSLDREMGLGIENDEPGLNEFALSLDVDLEGSSARDRIDLGIGFLEMGLYRLAGMQFASAAASRESGHDRETAALAAYALILDRRPFDAVMMLEPLITDMELSPSDKIDLLYLMARACQDLGKATEAVAWYGEVLEIDPRYRDAADRAQKARWSSARS